MPWNSTARTTGWTPDAACYMVLSAGLSWKLQGIAQASGWTRARHSRSTCPECICEAMASQLTVTCRRSSQTNHIQAESCHEVSPQHLAPQHAKTLKEATAQGRKQPRQSRNWKQWSLGSCSPQVQRATVFRRGARVCSKTTSENGIIDQAFQVGGLTSARQRHPRAYNK